VCEKVFRFIWSFAWQMMDLLVATKLSSLRAVTTIYSKGNDERAINYSDSPNSNRKAQVEQCVVVIDFHCSRLSSVRILSR